MSERTVRIAANEALFREVNEQIADPNTAAARRERLEVVCECGALSCSQPVSVSPDEYEDVRAHPTWFITKPGHQIEDVETIVEWHESFYVVAKKAGPAAELAKELDPRG